MLVDGDALTELTDVEMVHTIDSDSVTPNTGSQEESVPAPPDENQTVLLVVQDQGEEGRETQSEEVLTESLNLVSSEDQPVTTQCRSVGRTGSRLSDYEGASSLASVMLVELLSILTVGATTSTTEVTPTTSPQCERAPPHAQPADGHYRLGIAGDPDLFLPGELYTVSLQGVDSGQGPTPFTGFMIWAEMSRDHQKKGNDSNPTTNNQTLGIFQAYDAQAKIHDFCSPAVDNATAHSKTEIQVIWTAPSITAGACVRLSARVGPTISDNWSILARKLCAAPAAPASFAKQPPIVEPCCACDEAKYEVTFEGLWSRNTHPREFPPESAHAHFGDVIGATHTAQYRVWQEGRVASSGLRRLADDGATTALEKELKAESDHIRTIIKARGISWQQVAGGGKPSTFAVFRVDAKHHLVSLAAKLAPSPDWIVGVSALELCASNCTWTTSFSMPLYPYDAGTDNGLTYTSRRVPTIPAAPVRALRPDWPKDVRSPFFSSNPEMRPFARLRLNRLRLYEKSCDAGEHGLEPSSISVSKEGACSTHAWGSWSPCSVTCGEGYRMRQRDYMYPTRLAAETCRVDLTQREVCTGFRKHCRAPSEYEPDPAQSSGPCAVSEWSEWSPCEGCGVRARSRHYVSERAHKRCHIGYRARTILDQAMPCDAGPCEKAPDAYINATNYDWFFVDVPTDSDCSVSEWGPWSPCSARCGRGRRLRTRYYITRDHRIQSHVARTLLANWDRRYAELQMIESPKENITVDPEIEQLTQELLENCQFTLTLQEALCDGDDGSCEDVEVHEDVCKQPLLVGHCRGYQERWFYDFDRGSCEPFGFSGCGGNGNNFRTEIHCRKACVGRNFTTTTTAATLPPTTTVGIVINETILNKFKSKPSKLDNEVMINDAPVQDDVDCQTSRWLGWSECFGDCEFAVKLNYRIVVRSPKGSGTPCKRLIKSRSCTPGYCRGPFIQPATTIAPYDMYNMDDFQYND